MDHTLTDPEFHHPFGKKDDVTSSDPPPRSRPRVSLIELELALDDRSREASLRPGMHPVDAFNRELEARKKDNF